MLVIQRSPTRGTPCGPQPQGPFVRPAILFRNFQINISYRYVVLFFHRCLKVIAQQVNKILFKEGGDG